MKRKRRRCLSGLPATIATDLPCSRKNEVVPLLRLVSGAKCIDRVAVCVGDKLFFKADCNSRSAKNRFAEEAESLIHILSFRDASRR